MSSTEIFFDKYAIKGAYHWTELFGPLHRRNAYTAARYEAVLRAFAASGLAKGARVLDVGCGDAALSGLIAKRFDARLTGVDTNDLSIKLAREQFAKYGLSGEFQVLNGYEYPFGDGQFDAVVSSDVIEHVNEPARLLREMWRVLAPGGVAVLTTPIRYTEKPLDPMHVQEWMPSQFAGFCSGVFGVEVELRQSHPLAWTELYASAAPALGRAARLAINLSAYFGRNVFLSSRGHRAFSTQTVVAVKPRAIP